MPLKRLHWASAEARTNLDLDAAGHVWQASGRFYEWLCPACRRRLTNVSQIVIDGTPDQERCDAGR